LTAEAGGRDVFTVTLNANGSYTFELLDTIDHQTANGENVETLSFSIEGTPDSAALSETDYDLDAIEGLAGTTVTQSFAVDVTDDIPTAVDEADVTAKEINETVGSANGGANLLANDGYGADGPEGGAAQVVGFTYTDESGATQTGTLGTPVDTEWGTLTVNADGSWSYTVDSDVTAQELEDGQEDTFSYVIRDFDGDESTAEQTILIQDGGPEIKFPPPETEDGLPVSDKGEQLVDEDDLDTDDSDNVDGTDQDAVDNSHAGQKIFVTFGDDGPAATDPLVFEDPAVSGDLAAMGLTSDGVALTYTMNAAANEITATAGNGGPTIFTMTLSGDPTNGFSYDFDLVGQLDHATGAGENLISDIPFTVIATDGDGTQDSAPILIDVVDDVPVVDPNAIVVGTAATGMVDEDDLSDGTDDTKESLATGGDLGFGAGTIIPIDYGADGPGTNAPAGLGFSDLDFAIQGPAGLTSQGEAITYSQSGDVLTATAGTREVFTVEINSDGTYTFTLKDSIDHEDANGENVENLGFSLTATPNATAIASAIDNDGDPVDGLDDVEITQTFTVQVTDDVPEHVNNQPVVGTADTGAVDEDDLTDGTDQAKESLTTGGDLALAGGRALIGIDYGADGPATGRAVLA
jgi:T1SS-143 domain-containing protein